MTNVLKQTEFWSLCWFILYQGNVEKPANAGKWVTITIDCIKITESKSKSKNEEIRLKVSVIDLLSLG